MPQLLRLRFCNIGPHRARMEDLTLSFADIITGQATHSAIWLRNGGGKTTLISLILWLLCPDKPMPDKNQIEDYVQPDDRSVLIAEWQMDRQPSLWSGKPERYLTGAFCEWRTTSSSQEGRKLQRLFFATRVIEDEPHLSLDNFPIYVTKQGQLKRRGLGNFRQEWRELDHSYPQAEIEYTETLTEWREILERIGVDPELFRYQIRMNTREGGTAEPFLFRENDRFVDFFLELMGEAATGREIAETIKSFRQTLLFLHQQLEPEHVLLQTLTRQFTLLCEVAEEREHLCDQIRLVQKGITEAMLAVSGWIKELRQEQNGWEQTAIKAHEDFLRLREEVGQRRRRATLLRYTAIQKHVQQLQIDVTALHNLVQHTKQQAVIWQAAIPLRAVVRARAKAESIQAQLNALQQEHEPLLQTLQESACHYAAALSTKGAKLRSEEERLGKVAHEIRSQALDLRQQASTQEIEATKYDNQAKRIAEELDAFHSLSKNLADQGIIQSGEHWSDAQQRLKQEQSVKQKALQTLQGTLDVLGQEHQELREKLNDVKSTLFEIGTQIKLEQDILKPAKEARQQIADDAILQQYLEVVELDVDRLTPQALEILYEKRRTWDEQITWLRLTLAEQDAIIQYLSDYGFLPPAQAVAQVVEVLQKEHVIAWSGWHYLVTNVRETDRRVWLQRLPELAFGVVVPDEHWSQAQHVLQIAPLYLETPVVIFSMQNIQEETLARGWSIGPTSDAYFNPHAGSRELLNRQVHWQQLQDQLDELSSETSKLKYSINRLEHTLEHYPTSWWEEHHTLLAEAHDQQRSSLAQQKMLEQELRYCTTQIASRQQEWQSLQTNVQTIRDHLLLLQAHEIQLTVDTHALQEQEYQQRGQADTYRFQTQQLLVQAVEKDNEAGETTEKEKQTAEEARVIERERGEIHHVVGELSASDTGDLQLLKFRYESLYNQYHQKIGTNELTILHHDAVKEATQAYQQFQKKLQKSVQESEVHDALSTLSDLDDVEDLAQDALVKKIDAENERKSKQQELLQAEQELRGIKQKLTTQNIDEHELEDTLIESEEQCVKEAEEEERIATNSEQMAQQQKNTEQEARQQVQQCATHIESLKRVQNQFQMMQESYAPLLTIVAKAGFVPEIAELDTAVSSQEEQSVLQEEDIDQVLDTLQHQLKRMQEEKENLDRRGQQSSQEITRALNEVNREFKEVSLAKRLLEHSDEAYEKHGRTFLTELLSRQKWVQEEREKILVYRETLVQQLLALAESGTAFLNSASRYSKLPATLPAFEQRPFLRIDLTIPVSKDERVGKITDLLDAIVKEGAIPTGIELLQQSVRRLASPITVKILFPEPGALHYVPPTKMMKESVGERLTSMVLLYCTLLRMRAVHRTKPGGKSSCLILDNPIGVASRTLFLQLQREVAQAMDIQLIYTTAIKDFEALNIFPNVVRIHNNQRDRRTGDHLLMVDASPEGLEAMRIMHSEARNFSNEHQEDQ